MRNVANCDTIGDILHENDVDQHSKYWIWNGNDSNHIIIVHDANALQFVFFHDSPLVLLDYDALSVQTWKVDGHMGVVACGNAIKDWEGANCRKPTTRRNDLPLLQLEPNVFQCQIFIL